MSKKYVIFIILILLCLVTMILYFNLREYNISSNNDLNRVYNTSTEIEDIQLYIRNVLGENKVLISNENDIYDILNELYKTSIQNKIIDNDDIIGIATCRLTIKNVKNNTHVDINISKDEIVINNNEYYIKTNNNIFEVIKEIFLKYDEHALQC